MQLGCREVLISVALIVLSVSSCGQNASLTNNNIITEQVEKASNIQSEKELHTSAIDVSEDQMQYYDFQIAEDNPRNSEGAFIDIDENGILFIYSKFTEEDKDYSASSIVSVRSYDHGVTWTDYSEIKTEFDGSNDLMSVSLLRLSNGDIGLFYLARYSMDEMSIIMQQSSDNGRTWSEPRKCNTRSGYFVVNNDRVIMTSNKRIIIPASEHKAVYNNNGEYRSMTPGVVTFFMSDDDGATWSETNSPIDLDVSITLSGLQEPGVIELSENELWGWARTDLGRQYEFFSHDNGKCWTMATPSRFTSPRSPMSMKRISKSSIIAVWNPVPANNILTEDKITKSRTPLVYSISEDNGSTWRAPIIIEDNEEAGFCYTAIYIRDKDNILLAYCAGTKDDGSCMNRLRIRRLSLLE